MEKQNHEKYECAEGNEVVSMTHFVCWVVQESPSVAHFSRGRSVGEKGIFNTIAIRATMPEFAGFS